MVTKGDHYTDYPSLSAAIIGYGQLLRDNGFNVAIPHTVEVVKVFLEEFAFDHTYLKPAMSALLCGGKEEVNIFDTLYKRFWMAKGTRLSAKSDYYNKKNVHKNKSSIAVMMGIGQDTQEGTIEESKNTSGANAKETLKKTDFSKLTVHQSQELERLAESLVRDMSLRIKRRKKKSNKGRIDIQQSIRRNLQNGGMILDLAKRKKTKEKYKLLILLDVSGSMDKYSYYLLKFLWSLRHHFKDLEVFTFSTTLMRITEALKDRSIQTALSQVAQVSDNWSSGTKIGACLHEFNEHYSRFHLSGRTVTLILSDGLETGDVEQLESEIKRIKFKSKKLIWLNPLKGMKDYQPIQAGMAAVLPEVNNFASAHNFESLLALEDILIHA